MAQIVPAIIAKDFEDLKNKIKLVEPFVQTVQLDVMDGFFVPNSTWPFAANAAQDKSSTTDKQSVKDLDSLETNLFLEAHLMIENPHQFLNEWLASPVKRVILHWEALEKIHNHELPPYKTQVNSGFPISNLAEEVHANNKEFGIALNPETSIRVLDNFISEIDYVLLMSVEPGFAGQSFKKSVIPKTAALRQKYPNVKIGVDGGVNSENIKQLVEVGADFLAVGSAIFDQPEVSAAIINFKKLIE